jgi:hypothetical protein
MRLLRQRQAYLQQQAGVPTVAAVGAQVATSEAATYSCSSS